MKEIIAHDLSDSLDFSTFLISKLSRSSSIWFPIYEILDDDPDDLACGLVIVQMSSPNAVFYYYDVTGCHSEMYSKIIDESIKPFVLEVMRKDKANFRYEKIKYASKAVISYEVNESFSKIVKDFSLEMRTQYYLLYLCAHLIIFADFDLNSASVKPNVLPEDINCFLENFKYVVAFIVLNRELSYDLISNKIVNIVNVVKELMLNQIKSNITSTSDDEDSSSFR